MISGVTSVVADAVYRLVYVKLAVIASIIRALQGARLKVTGLENMPRHGGAVLACNHIGYMDPMYLGLVALMARRRMRYLAKKEVWDHPVTRFLAVTSRGIPVDRSAGTSAYQAAVRALCEGDFVGVCPEATISRSFELKEFKSGAARMAVAAGVPVVPIVLWGTQRIATKGQPPKFLGWNRQVQVHVGTPIEPGMPPQELTTRLHSDMEELLHAAQAAHGPHPPGRHWVPARLGGTAPTLAEANAMDARELSWARKDGLEPE
ncbi:1-acyl-sn-glycerol-3-phosphate acyltransferase [Hoyosella sp. G463]|uniref:1-acyl-sn-glycerol-3-phosphate acyltransferase n=1 Tax=Lolliginicoccus lacisalsi TaxID=2742202 RepID=A0A927PMX0_9ACTN|nr:lysophospholipid acyltransferase family protein [Lolliginicoccus lacisalsi]MBD8506946.1 1-acyl-sn-glycerol-3-phosphate acyltransferase [Lolliginicoccus lacisalsi]